MTEVLGAAEKDCRSSSAPPAVERDPLEPRIGSADAADAPRA